VLGRSRRAKAVTLLLLWLGAYTTLMALFTLFGPQLDGMPVALRTLLVSAVLVLVMSQLVIPAVARFVSRRWK
jgi:antibiotic biosynthesis monooxygenase (ABM) superfamily enzyme